MSQISPRFCVYKWRLIIHWHCFQVPYTRAQLYQKIIFILKDPYMLNPHATMTVQWAHYLIFFQLDKRLTPKNVNVTCIFSLSLSFLVIIPQKRFSISVKVRLLTSLISMLYGKQGSRKGLRSSQIIPFLSNFPCCDFLGLLIIMLLRI